MSKLMLWLLGIPFIIIALLGGYLTHLAFNHKNAEESIRSKVWIDQIPPTAAPDFTLTDQNGKTVTLSAFRGKAVLLHFINPLNNDFGSRLAQELQQTQAQLGQYADQVEYIAVSMNPNSLSQKSAVDFTAANGFGQLSNWHFVTGDSVQLQALWKAYQLDVNNSSSSLTYFIDPSGNEQYLAYPEDKPGTIHDWAEGIAYFIKKML